MKVRPAKFSDSAEIVEIWNPYIKKTFVTFNSSEKTQEEVWKLVNDRRNRGHEFWVAIQDDKIIGFASYDQLRAGVGYRYSCLLYTSPSPRDISGSRMPSSA